jgi:phosphatidylserine/phosphatidylglycerophosphate/cardiolipin synthase-like enzyme
MQKIKPYLFTLIFIYYSSLLFGQHTIKENDYTVTFQKESIAIQFEMPVALKAYDNTTAAEINVTHNANEPNLFVLQNTKPAQIIKLQYTYLYGRNYQLQTHYLASPSSSTGTIDVFFNHIVNTAFAQTQNAVNLANTLDDRLITYINACVSTLDIAIYNSYSPSSTAGIAGAINAAYNRGVQVRVIYDGSTTSSMIGLLNPAIPTIASPNSAFYGIMHNKFVIFDANNSDATKPYVWTGSTNWTTAQIDGPDLNSAIVIQDQALALGYKIEFEEMWGSTTLIPNATLSKFGPNKTNNTPHSYIIGGKVVNSYFSPSDGTTAKIITAINSANSDIDIATMLITRSDIKDALLAKYNSGLFQVNIVLDSQNPSGNQFANLQSGINTNQVIQFTGTGIMHHKFMVIDNDDATSDPQVVVGSHNWSNSAETRNDENILIVHNANITNQYYQAFAYIYQQAGGVLATNQNAMVTDAMVIYPNPTKGIFNITSSTIIEDSNISVYDVFGHQLLQKQSTDLLQETIDLSGYANGLYLISVSSKDKKEVFKVVKE